MAFSITQSGRLLRDGRAVELIDSPASHTGGAIGTPPKVIVMHFTFGGTARSSADWFRSPQNSGKSSAHVVIERDGSVIQCVPFTTFANHAGKSTWTGAVGMNRHSFGIEMANWGYLTRKPDGWTTWTGQLIADPVLAVHKNGNPDGSATPLGWEPYRAAQIEAAEGIARALIAKFGCDEIVGHEDISKGRKWDPGPGFDMAQFRSSVLEDMADPGDNSLSVTVAEGLNLRRGPGIAFEVIKLLAAGTRVTPIEQSGNWLMVNVLNPSGSPTLTGWAHKAFLG